MARNANDLLHGALDCELSAHSDRLRPGDALAWYACCVIVPPVTSRSGG